MTEAIIPQEQILRLLAEYPKERRYVLAAMQDMQRLFGYLPRQGLDALAEHFCCPLSGVYSMATFYKALSLKPKGRHVIKVCDGTACHIRGAVNIVGGIARTLGIRPGQTTEDGEFSVELVSCVGTCALAPVIVIGETYYGKVKVDELPGIFDALREEAAR